jgi:hypothetical protein
MGASSVSELPHLILQMAKLKLRKGKWSQGWQGAELTGLEI